MTAMIVSGRAGPIPADHDCERCGCVFPEDGWHSDEYGFCLACGGCGDPECCSHGEACQFDHPMVFRCDDPEGDWIEDQKREAEPEDRNADPGTGAN